MISAAFFNFGTALYAVSAYLYLVGWRAKSRRSQSLARNILLGAVILHVGATVGRALEYGFPFLTLREVLAVYAWVLAFLYLVLEFRFGYTVIGVLITPLGTLIILVASLLPTAREPLLAMLQSPWLMTHVGIFFSAYAAFSLAFATALAYLWQERALRHKRLALRLPSLGVMDNLTRWLITVGLLLMVGAIFTGSAWAERVWGTPWVWEPKQVMSLVTLGVYALYFYVRHVSRWSGRRTSWLVVAGFISVLTTFIGADLMARSSLHRFIFP